MADVVESGFSWSHFLGEAISEDVDAWEPIGNEMLRVTRGGKEVCVMVVDVIPVEECLKGKGES